MHYLIAALSFYFLWVLAMGFAPNVVLRGVPDTPSCFMELYDTLSPTLNKAGCSSNLFADGIPDENEFLSAAKSAAIYSEIKGDTDFKNSLAANLVNIRSSHTCRGGFSAIDSTLTADAVTDDEMCYEAAKAWNVEFLRPSTSPERCYYRVGDKNAKGYMRLDKPGGANFASTHLVIVPCTKPLSRQDILPIVNQVNNILQRSDFIETVALRTTNDVTAVDAVFPGGLTNFYPGSLGLKDDIDAFDKMKGTIAKGLELYTHGTIPGPLALGNQYNSIWYRMTDARTEWFSCHDPQLAKGDIGDLIDILGGQQCYSENVSNCDLLRGLHVGACVAILVAIGLAVAVSIYKDYMDRVVASLIAALVMFASLTPVATLVIEGQRAHGTFFDLNYILAATGRAIGAIVPIVGAVVTADPSDGPAPETWSQVGSVLVSASEPLYPQATCGYSWPILIERVALTFGKAVELTNSYVASGITLPDISSPQDAVDAISGLDSIDLENVLASIGYDVEYSWGYYLQGVTIGVGTMLWVALLYFGFRGNGYKEALLI